MHVEDWLKRAEVKLSRAGITTARLDCLVLLEDGLSKNRTQILAHPDLLVNSNQQRWLNIRIKRRMRHEPLAYIRGKSEFYGREFIIDKRVLEPRPESETMIDLLKSSKPSPTFHIADVGTGSGALGITAKIEFPKSSVALIDIDDAAMAVAKLNVDRYDVEVSTIINDLLIGVSQQPDIILANLPYVPDNFQINPAAQAEPRLAIFGGSDGLDVYRRLFSQLQKLPWRPHAIFTEALPPQHRSLAAIAEQAGFKLARSDDFIQQFVPLLD